MSTTSTTKQTDSTKTTQDGDKTAQPNEGEGNRTAARRYDAATEKYIASGRSGPAAKAAAEALDGPEADALRAAEEVGKKGHPARKNER